MRLLITCPYGLGSLLAHEIKKLGFNPDSTFQTGTFVTCDMKGMMKINYHSRLANKVYVQLTEGRGMNFDELFNLIKTCNYSQYLSNTNISIKVESKNSKLSSIRAIQSVSHKALLESISRFGTEEKHVNDLLLIIDHDIVKLYLNTSGAALYQRGYKKEVGEAPLKENLAVALLILSGWKFKTPLIDPFCGSGTIAIEAALMAKNIAPGTWRKFNFEYFKNFEHGNFTIIKEEAKKHEFSGDYAINTYDIDSNMVSIAKSNANNAGVLNIINFKESDFLKTSFDFQGDSWIVCNPPYGKRLRDDKLFLIYEKLDKLYTNSLFGGWISSYNYTPRNSSNWNKKKLYNGADECTFYWRKH